MPRMPMSPCNHCPTMSSAPNASENLKLKILEDKLRNDLAEKEHTHDQYLTEENINGLATEQFVEEKVNSIVFPETDLTGFATEEWVESKNYLTEHQDISGKQENIEDLEEIREGANLGKTALQEIPAEYITEEELEAKQYLTEHQSLEGYAKESFVEQKVAELVDSAPEALNTLNELAVAINNHEDAYDALLETVGNKANKEHTHDQYLTEHQSLEGYAKLADIPEVELYKVDFNAPNYSEAVEAYNNGKMLVLINAAPDVNSYAIMNYVSDTFITFTKFLISRSESYGAFNTYYLKNDNSWEFAKEVKLNKVEITAEGNLQIGKELYITPNLEGLATEQFVENKIAELVDAAPETLNTLGELAAAISENGDIIETLNSAVVDKADKTALEDLNTSLSEKIEKNTVSYNELNNTVSNLVIPENLSELVNDTNYTNEERVLELIENNASTKIGFDFITNITVGHLKEGTEITADMTIGQIIKNILCCEHEYETFIEEPTCIDDGYTRYKCINCGYSYEEAIPADPSLHRWEEIPYIEPDCNNAGNESGSYCTICDTREGGEYIPSTGHVYGTTIIEGVEPTCTETGLTDGSVCARCWEEFVPQQVIPALGHDYGDWVITKQPEVGVPGEQTKTCKRCDEVITEEIPALEPEEPTELKYLAGTFGNTDDLQEWPEPFINDWSEEEQEEISMHYVNNMIEYSVASEEDLVGRHGFDITTPFVKESNSLAAYGEVSEDPYTTRPAIVLPIGYEVTAWNTDVDNSSLSECTVYKYDLVDGRTVYYAGGFTQQTGAMNTHYLTIVKN